MSESPRTSTLPPGFAKLAAIMMTGVVAVFLDTTVVNVAIDSLAGHFHTTVTTAQWAISGYLLAMGVVIPIAGWLTDRLGAKAAWITAMSLFAIGSLLCSLAPNTGALIGFRVVQGVGGGLMLPIMQMVLMRAAGPRPSNRAVAAVALPAVLGPILGPVLGGVILQYLDWRAIFWVNLPLCAAALIMALRGMEATAGRSASLDVAGLVLLSPGLAAILYGLTEAGGHDDFSYPAAMFPLIGGVLLLAGFIGHALRAAKPLVELRPFATRSFSASTLVLFLAGLSVYGAMLLLPLYYLQVQHLSVLDAGLCLVPQGFGTLISRAATAKLADRVGPRPVVTAGILLAGIATVPFARADASTGLVFLALILVVRGLGLGAVTIIVMASAYQDLEDRGMIPHATAAIRIGQQVGNAFGTTVLAMLLQTQLTRRAGAAGTVNAFHDAFWWSIGLSVVTALPALALPHGAPAAAAPAGPAQPQPTGQAAR